MNTSEAFHLLHFDPLLPTRQSLAFMCDSWGIVNLDRLEEASRLNYFYARSLIGREFAPPRVCRVDQSMERTSLCTEKR